VQVTATYPAASNTNHDFIYARARLCNILHREGLTETTKDGGSHGVRIVLDRRTAQMVSNAQISPREPRAVVEFAG
jgi:hypothetical protein